MSVYQLDLARIIQVFVVQAFICVFFVFIAYKIIKRDKKRLNILFSLVYISITIGLLINMLYALILEELIVLILCFITQYSIGFGPIFCTVFNLILLKSEKVITKKKQTIIILIYGILLALSVLFLPLGGIIINAETDWKSVWNLPFFLYFITIITLGTTIPNFYTSIKVYKQFKSEDLKKKWKFFIIGFCGLYFYMYGAFTANLLDILQFRLIMSVVSLTVVFFLYLMYYGVGRQLEK